MIFLPSNCKNQHLKKSSTPLILFSLAIIVSLSGCAQKPWRDSLNDSDRLAVLKTLHYIRNSQASRSSCIDADLNIFFTSHFKKRAISGYVQIMQPSLLKFIVSNPFGQPLFAFTTDGSQFNQIDTAQQQFMDGDLETFARIYDSPPFMYNRPWGKWLTARLPDSEFITDIRKDSSDRGSWVTIVNQAKIEADEPQPTAAAAEHVLIDIDNRRLLGRIFTGRGGDIEAEITYSDWSTDNNWQPGKITLEGLDYGSRIVLELTEMSNMGYCSATDFRLRKPAGYTYTPVWENR